MDTAKWTREDVGFSSGNDRCAAWLYKPSNTSEKSKTHMVVMAHGLGAIKEMRLDAFAERICGDGGYLCLVFDYRNFGASTGQCRQNLSISMQEEDWDNAVAYALDRDDVDKVFAWGSSFGGGHVMRLAAREKRLAGALSQCPFTDGIASFLGAHPLSVMLGFPLALADLIAYTLFGISLFTLKIVGRAGEPATMSGDIPYNGYLKLVPPSRKSTFPNYVWARFGLFGIFYFPGAACKNISCPIFVAIAENDSVAPPGPTKKYAAQAPRGQVKVYSAEHFDFYVGECFEELVGDQIEFLKQHAPNEK